MVAAINHSNTEAFEVENSRSGGGESQEPITKRPRGEQIEVPCTQQSKIVENKLPVIEKPSSPPASDLLEIFAIDVAGSDHLAVESRSSAEPLTGPITPLATPPRGGGDSRSYCDFFWQDSPESHRRRTTTGGSSQWRAELFGSDIVSSYLRYTLR